MREHLSLNCSHRLALITCWNARIELISQRELMSKHLDAQSTNTWSIVRKNPDTYKGWQWCHFFFYLKYIPKGCRINLCFLGIMYNVFFCYFKESIKITPDSSGLFNFVKKKKIKRKIISSGQKYKSF